MWVVTSDKTARWLELLAYLLQYRFPVSREQIFAGVRGYESGDESARRKFERDKDELRATGIEIETVDLPDAAGDEPATGYRLRAAGFYLPYFELARAGDPGSRPYPGVRRIQLSDTELAALDRATRRLTQLTNTSLASAGRAARRKLAFDLPLAADATGLVLELPLPEEGRQSLEVLQQAVASNTAVACRYYTISRDAEEDREIEPYGIFFQWGHWYGVARARDRNALRVFRADRMRNTRLLRNDTFSVPADFDIRRFLGLAPWEMGDGPVTVVRVRFAFPMSRWVENQRVGRPVEAAGDDGSLVLEFDVRDRAAFLRWLLSFRGTATLPRPPQMAVSWSGSTSRTPTG